METKSMKIHKAFKYRVYPNEGQRQYFQKTFEAVRFVWNKMLYDRMEYFKETGKSTTICPAKYKAEHPWLKEIDSLALANTQLRLEASYRGFFKMGKHYCSEKTIAKAKRQKRELTFYDCEKHPKFKAKAAQDRKSYTTNNQKGTIEIVGNCIKLPKVGLIKCKIHRSIPDDCVIKSATISQTATGKYFVSVLVETEKKAEPKEPINPIGLAFGGDELHIGSESRKKPWPEPYPESEAKLARERRRLGHMRKGSCNYRKQMVKIAKLQEKAASRHRDFLHKQSSEISKAYDAVYIQGMGANAESNGNGAGGAAISGAWEMFLRFLEYKQMWRGHHVIR